MACSHSDATDLDSVDRGGSDGGLRDVVGLSRTFESRQDRHKVRKIKNCRYCGKSFEPQGSRLGYCSVRCGANTRKERNGNAWEHAIAGGILWWALRWKRCENCYSYTFGKRLIRCIACHEKHRIKIRRLTKKLFGNHRKRSKTYGVPYEAIKASDIYKRDKYRCQLCGKNVDPTKSPPHPLTPTIDNIIPMSKGGGHVWGNVQCACFECNCCRKRDTIHEETQMVLC